jgi:hypothetical protein
MAASQFLHIIMCRMYSHMVISLPTSTIRFDLIESYMVSTAKCSYARMAGLADSRRGANVNLHPPTSLLKEPSVPRGLPLPGFYLRLCTFRL